MLFSHITYTEIVKADKSLVLPWHEGGGDRGSGFGI